MSTPLIRVSSIHRTGSSVSVLHHPDTELGSTRPRFQTNLLFSRFLVGRSMEEGDLDLVERTLYSYGSGERVWRNVSLPVRASSTLSRNR